MQKVVDVMPRLYVVVLVSHMSLFAVIKIVYHIEHIAKVFAKNDSTEFPYDCVCI